MSPLLLIIYYLLLVVLAWRNLKWAVYLVCLTLPAYLIRFQISGIPMTVLEGEILILFLVWAGKSCHSGLRAGIQKSCCWIPGQARDDKKNKLLYYSIALLLITSFVSVFVSPSFRSAAGIWRAYFLEPLLFFVVFINIIKREDLKNIFWSLSSSVFLLSLFALYQKFTGAFIANPFWADAATRRVTSVFPYPNALALFLAPLVVTMIGVIVSGRQRVRVSKGKNITLLLYYFITFITAFLAVYWTRSKGALLAILAGIIFYAVFFKGQRKIFVWALVAGIILVFLYSCIYGLPNIKGNSTVAGGDSISTRVDMWSETWAMLKTRPILGAGLAGYQAMVAPFHQKSYIEVYLYPHNIFLNFWSEIGLFGLLAFLGIVAWFYRAGFKEIRDTRYELGIKTDNQQPLFIILLAALTTLLVHGLVDVPYFKNDLSVLFWIMVASMVVATQINANKNTN